MRILHTRAGRTPRWLCEFSTKRRQNPCQFYWRALGLGYENPTEGDCLNLVKQVYANCGNGLAIRWHFENLPPSLYPKFEETVIPSPASNVVTIVIPLQNGMIANAHVEWEVGSSPAAAYQLRFTDISDPGYNSEQHFLSRADLNYYDPGSSWSPTYSKTFQYVNGVPWVSGHNYQFQLTPLNSQGYGPIYETNFFVP